MNIIYNKSKSVAVVFFCASGVGGAARIIFVEIFSDSDSLIMLTLVNVSGSFLLGIIVSRNISMHDLIIWGTGFCGGFTSFSALSYLPFIDNASNSFFVFVVYVYVNLVLALLCIWLGYVFLGKNKKGFKDIE